MIWSISGIPSIFPHSSNRLAACGPPCWGLGSPTGEQEAYDKRRVIQNCMLAISRQSMLQAFSPHCGNLRAGAPASCWRQDKRHLPISHLRGGHTISAAIPGSVKRHTIKSPALPYHLKMTIPTFFRMRVSSCLLLSHRFIYPYVSSIKPGTPQAAALHSRVTYFYTNCHYFHHTARHAARSMANAPVYQCISSTVFAKRFSCGLRFPSGFRRVWQNPIPH